MSRPRIFVSHSAKEPLARQLLPELENAIDAVGCEPFVDYARLQPGQEWRQILLQEAQSAHAVIVFVSPSALGSEWVHREATLAMANRHDEWGLERVFVLRTPDVSSAHIRDSVLGGIALHEIHSAKAGDPVAVHEAVTRMLADIHAAHCDRPTETLEAALVGWLSELAPAGLGIARNILGLPATTRPSALAMHIAQRLLEFPGDPLLGVHTVQEFLTKVPVRLEKLVVDILLSAAVLPLSVHSQLREVLDRQERIAVGVAVASGETGRIYLRRACMQREPWLNHSADGVQAHGHLEQLLADVRAYLVEKLGFLDDDPNDEMLDAELRAYESACGPITVTVHAPPDAQLVRQLRSRFRRVLFVFVAGNDYPAQDTAGVRWLTPPMATDVERKVLRTRRQVWARHQLAS